MHIHRDVSVVLAEQAAAGIRSREYYQEVEEAQLLLEAGKVRQLGIGAE